MLLPFAARGERPAVVAAGILSLLMLGVGAPAAPFSITSSEDRIAATRLFEGPLLRTGGIPSAAENRDLALALQAVQTSRDVDPFGPVEAFLDRHPSSGWRAALMVNMGAAYRAAGRVTRAIERTEEAWALTRYGTGANERTIANWALAGLFEIHSHLGHARRLEELFVETAHRQISGPASERMTLALEKLQRMRNNPEMSFRCGPESLARIGARAGVPADSRVLAGARATSRGMSLTQLEELSRRAGMPVRATRRDSGAAIPLPAVMHWKVDHYTAVLERRVDNGHEYFLVDNPLFEGRLWMARETLEAESSGYFLIPDAPLAAGWNAVSAAEGSGVLGRCFDGTLVEAQITESDQFAQICMTGPGGSRGMPRYRFHSYLANLNVKDEPLGYAPPRGPAVRFGLTYNHRDAFQPAAFSFANLGPKWTFDWMAWVTDNGNPRGSARVYVRGGGMEAYVENRIERGSSANSPDTVFYFHHFMSHAELAALQTNTRTGRTDVYERRLPDGSKEVYSLADGTLDGTGNRRIFLTAIVDAAGNQVKIAYDSRFRITAVTDAIGQTVTLSYEMAADPLKITKVTDPFGRSAVLTYDEQGHLSSVTDVAGLSSRYQYVNGDFMSAMTTPYGTTTFRASLPGDPRTTSGRVDRTIEAVDPLGGTEHLELRFRDPTRADIYGSTLYWDKRAWEIAPGEVKAATVTHWAEAGSTAYGLPHYEQRPLESQRSFLYADDHAALISDGKISDGRSVYEMNFVGRPARITQRQDDGSNQTYKLRYNVWGKPTEWTDPAGRQLLFDYNGTGQDLLQIHNSFGNATVAKLTYNAQHLPLTYTDAAGQTTTYTYNPQGQLLSVTNARHETTNFTYDSRGYLTRIAAPFPGATASFTYDNSGRVESSTDSEAYRLIFAYDALDRPVKTTYPDGTFEETSYDRLDAVRFRDRLGRITQTAYDALQRPVSITDPLGQTRQMAWCSCGQVAQLTDAAGNATIWNRDIQGRVIGKVLADGSATQYRYDNSLGRVTQVVDAKGQTTSYQYNPDGTLQQIDYSGGSGVTPAVSFTYDPHWPRLISQTDGSGSTTYSYHNPGSLGALQLSAITGVWGETTAYSYDELGRMVSRSIDGVSVARAYDSLNNITSESSPLGRTAFSYLRATGRLQSVLLPNGQSTALTYFDNTGDQRLRQIKNLGSDGAVLSEFDHTYAASGEVQTLTRQISTFFGGLPTGYQFAYDANTQLLAATLGAGDGSVIGAFNYAYDAAGNRTLQQVNDSVSTPTYNNVNELADASYVYDGNGNLIGDGIRSFEWDAEDRLTAVVVGVHRSEFGYDGSSRRVRIVEKDSGAVVNDKHLVWCGASICEERDVVNGRTKRFFTSGEMWSQDGVDTAYYYTRDRLGSIREMTDSSGAVVASYDYDAWGRVSSLSGSIDSAFGYAGYYVHPPSGLYLTQYRAYDSNLGKWLSRDPVGVTAEEVNLYRYVGGNPTNRVDPLGLEWWTEPLGNAIRWVKNLPAEKLLELEKNPTPLNSDNLSKQIFLQFVAPSIQNNLQANYDTTSQEILKLDKLTKADKCPSTRAKTQKKRQELALRRVELARSIAALHIVYTNTYNQLEKDLGVHQTGKDSNIYTPDELNFTF